MGDVIALPHVDRGQLDQAPAQRPDQPAPEPLWREAVGQELREERRRQERTLADVAEVAGVSTQYLSEVERGRKEPSSEILGAVTGALGLRLADLTGRVARTLSAPLQASRPQGPLAMAA